MSRPIYVDETLNLVVEYVPRSEWGSSAATEEFISERVRDPKLGKTELHIHHTASIDDDETPNLWTLEDAKRYARRLQTARPDLGPLPYSEMIALSEDHRTVWILEGRGLTVRGAHTGGGHNVPGIGIAFFGNFDGDVDAVDLARALRTVEFRARDLRHRRGFSNLGSSQPPGRWSEVWGHRDSKSTSCPGSRIYAGLPGIQFINEKEISTMSRPLTDYEKKAIAQMEDLRIYTEYTTDEPGEVDEAVTYRKLAVFLDRLLDVVAAGVNEAISQIDSPAGPKPVTKTQVLRWVRDALVD